MEKHGDRGSGELSGWLRTTRGQQEVEGGAGAADEAHRRGGRASELCDMSGQHHI